MIVSARRRLAARRPGFTLLEVLVVVAILVILAGVAGVYVFGFLDAAKTDIAADQCGKIERAIEAYMLKSQTQGQPPQSLQILYTGDNTLNPPLQPVLDGGPSSIISPFGPQYPFNYEMVSDGFRQVPRVTVQNPQNGQLIYSKKWQSLMQQ